MNARLLRVGSIAFILDARAAVADPLGLWIP